MSYGLQNIGLGRDAATGGSRGSTTTDTAEQQTPTQTHEGGSYSSDGTVERWYFDPETGRTYYTAGPRAGTYEQTAEPRPKKTATVAPEGDNGMLWMMLPVGAALLVYFTSKGKKKTKKRKK